MLNVILYSCPSAFLQANLRGIYCPVKNLRACWDVRLDSLKSCVLKLGLPMVQRVLVLHDLSHIHNFFVLPFYFIRLTNQKSKIVFGHPDLTSTWYLTKKVVVIVRLNTAKGNKIAPRWGFIHVCVCICANIFFGLGTTIVLRYISQQHQSYCFVFGCKEK